MIRLLALTVLIFAGVQAYSQEPSVGKAYISGQIVGAEDQEILFGNRNKGGLRTPLSKITTDSEGKFSFEYDLPFKDYYFLGFSTGATLNLILHGNDTIKIYGDIKNILELSNFVGSEESEAMNQFLVSFQNFKRTEDSLKFVVRKDPSKGVEVNEYFNPIATTFYAQRNKFLKIYAQSPAIVVAANAVDQNLEWDLYSQIVGLLDQSFGASPTIKGFVKDYNNKVAEKEAKKFLEPGNPAKDIKLPTPEGDSLALSSLKGNVVLIDFWASWCKPCRLENPNVVNMYNKYKDEGFTVYSVSLDNNGDRWKQAIEQDGLVWPNHVSDLAGWKSIAAKAYLVKSIPFTVLVDKEGKIVGTNIRGEQLQTQLKAIFGH